MGIDRDDTGRSTQSLGFLFLIGNNGNIVRAGLLEQCNATPGKIAFPLKEFAIVLLVSL